VRMRSRKPWVLARRRLFGWKVRLLTSNSVFESCPGGQSRHTEAARRHFTRVRRSNRPTLRRATESVNHILGRHADRRDHQVGHLVFLRAS
jgi:hypothetical protein